MLAKVRVRPEEGEPLDPVVADAVRLPLPDRSVDVVLLLGVLCCMTDDAVPPAVDETWRVLRPGGFALVTVPLARGDADDPTFRARGFRAIARLRPGRTLYLRPASAADLAAP